MKKVFKIIGMHCASCSMTIDGDLEDFVKGVKSAKTNYVKQVCEVEFDAEKATTKKIIEQIKKTGYQAMAE